MINTNRENTMIEKVTDIDGTVTFREAEESKTELPTHITNGIKHHFQPGDQIKQYDEDSFFIIYGDVVRINKKTITIEYESWYGKVQKRVCPSTLNWD